MQLGTLGWVRVVLAQHVPHSETEGLHDYYIRRGELSDDDQARMTEIEERLQAIEEEIEDATEQDVVSRLEAENDRSEDRREGKECVNTGRDRWSTDH